eukprot:scaffold173651_cov29-Tisochrysis_lutea.AAC.3
MDSDEERNTKRHNHVEQQTFNKILIEEQVREPVRLWRSKDSNIPDMKGKHDPGNDGVLVTRGRPLGAREVPRACSSAIEEALESLSRGTFSHSASLGEVSREADIGSSTEPPSARREASEDKEFSAVASSRLLSPSDEEQGPSIVAAMMEGPPSTWVEANDDGRSGVVRAFVGSMPAKATRPALA